MLALLNLKLVNMKVSAFIFILATSVCSLRADNAKINFSILDVKKVNEIESSDIEKILKEIDYKSIGVEDVLQIVKNTSGFDYVDYLVKNEKISIGTPMKWVGGVSNVKDPVFKEFFLKANNENKTFKKMYQNVSFLHEIRINAIAAIFANKLDLKNKNEFYLFLQPYELIIFREHEISYIVEGHLFDGNIKDLIWLKKKAFKIKYDLPLQSEIKNKNFTAKEIMTLMNESTNYVRSYNVYLLAKTIYEKGKENSWDDMLMAFKIYKEFDTYERYLYEDNNVHGYMQDLLMALFGIITYKDYYLKNKEIENILGTKAYYSVFVDKKELNKIPQFSFDDENKLLDVIVVYPTK